MNSDTSSSITTNINRRSLKKASRIIKTGISANFHVFKPSSGPKKNSILKIPVL